MYVESLTFVLESLDDFTNKASFDTVWLDLRVRKVEYDLAMM